MRGYSFSSVHGLLMTEKGKTKWQICSEGNLSMLLLYLCRLPGVIMYSTVVLEIMDYLVVTYFVLFKCRRSYTRMHTSLVALPCLATLSLGVRIIIVAAGGRHSLTVRYRTGVGLGLLEEKGN
ncbi:uncharacterized protein LOC113358666 [Papaver somniferum]|uniref:uncharacterized protein LOC113358666 n=1 Tax=Papaver somniferum TaxID=3469 RepID=UPI000E6F8638|nr:uncharacterized protein LOC113358666 [Papaver somniferum]